LFVILCEDSASVPYENLLSYCPDDLSFAKIQNYAPICKFLKEKIIKK
jgi:hypothetical protein